MNLNRTTSFFILIIAIVYLLVVGKDLIIPFVFAVLLWFLIREIRQGMNRVNFLRKRVASWVKSLMAAALILAVLGAVSKILSNSIRNLARSYDKYESNVGQVIQNINSTFDVNLMDMMRNQVGTFDFGLVLTSVFNSLTDIISNAFIILIYALFVFLEEINFSDKLRALFQDEVQYEKTIDVLGQVENSVSRYLGLKTVVSLITGVMSYIALYFIGIDSPVFWAFLIFLLNFIPTIGSLIATVFPAVFCLLQFGDFTPSILVLLIVGGIQVLVGNVLEPKLVGNSLNISPLVAILSLTFWGSIWGITGMILSVPITVIMVIIFSKFPSTRAAAILLSDKGKVS